MFIVTAALLLATSIVAESASIPQPGCNRHAAPAQMTLDYVRTSQINVPHSPFGLAYATRQKNVAFVSLDDDLTGKSTLGVLNTSAFVPRLIHQIALPAAYVGQEGALGITLTEDGRHLLVAAGPGAIILDTAQAAIGSASAVVGTLNGTTGTQSPGVDAIEVTVNQRYAFVSQEYGNGSGDLIGNVDVFELHHEAHNRSISGTPIGSVTLGRAVVGTALSPCGRYLYAVSEIAATGSALGVLSVLDVEKLETEPRESRLIGRADKTHSQAILSNATAGCGPVRVLVSSDGKVVWTTARTSNYLIAFDAEKLLSDNPDNALIASVQVGTSPVGLTFAKNESRILTADSNRFSYPNATSGISVVDVHAALNGSASAVFGRIPTGLFPREFATSLDGNTILVADYASSQIQAIDVATLP